MEKSLRLANTEKGMAIDPAFLIDPHLSFAAKGALATFLAFEDQMESALEIIKIKDDQKEIWEAAVIELIDKGYADLADDKLRFRGRSYMRSSSWGPYPLT